MSRKKTLLLSAILLSFLCSGCLAATIITGVRMPGDATVASPNLTPRGKVMVIPPSGTARGQFDSVIALFEREFLKRGITVISGAITGRVVIDAGTGSEKRVEAAAGLSDAERALIMAKETGADAILQIGQFNWTDAPIGTRFFVCCRKGMNTYSEVLEPEYHAWTGAKATLASRWLQFVGRLIDVRNGEVLASFSVGAGANFNLQSDQSVPLGQLRQKKSARRGAHEEIWQPSDLAGVNWNLAEQVTMEKVIGVVAQHISSK